MRRVQIKRRYAPRARGSCPASTSTRAVASASLLVRTRTGKVHGRVVKR